LGDPDLTISHEQATNLVGSPAVQRLALDFFKQTGVPMVGHTAKRMPVEGSPWNLYIEPPARLVDASGTQTKPMSFRWINPSGVLEKHDVVDGSVLRDLGELCSDLARRHPITE